MDTAELAALDHLKKKILENYSKYFDDFLSGERSLPFGLPVSKFEMTFLRNSLNYEMTGILYYHY